MRIWRSAGALLIVVSMVAGCGTTDPPTWNFGPQSSAAPSQAAASAAPSTAPSASASATAPTPDPSPSTPAVAPAETAIPGGWAFIRSQPCPESAFECVTLAVPRDHFTAGGPTWEITFAIHGATEERTGTFVVATGGPGTSGIAEADGYAFEDYPTAIAETQDVVFFDQRGIGLSRPFQCPEATGDYYAMAIDPTSIEEAAAAGAASKAYVEACLTESGIDRADLPYLSTRQAVEDLEAIREYLEVDKLHLYGESYGTQYAQTYAAAHPDRIETLFLDGPVDLTLSGPASWAEATRSFDDTLLATLAECEADLACREDVGADPLVAWDALAASLDAGPITYTWVNGDGTTEERQFTRADLDNATVSYLYYTGDRSMLLRALASAADNDLMPLARLAYYAIGVDPETLEVVPDPTYSDALYYGVECQDYAYYPDAGDEISRLAAYVEGGLDQGMDDLRLGAVYYGDLPCIYWPSTPTTDARPAPIVDPPYRMVVMGAVADPITAVANVMRLYGRSGANGHAVVTQGGPHVILGWGESCPDEMIAAYLATGEALPAMTFCEGPITDGFVPVAEVRPEDYATALEAMASTDDQIVNHHAYYELLDADPISVGCDWGGILTYTPTDTRTDLTLAGCEFTDGLAMTGSGAIDDETGGLTLDVTTADGALEYERDGDGERTVSGSFRGEPAD